MSFLKNSYWVTFPLIMLVVFYWVAVPPCLWKSTYPPTICDIHSIGSQDARSELLGSSPPIWSFELMDHSGLILQSHGRLPELYSKFKHRSLYSWDESVYIVLSDLPPGRYWTNCVFCKKIENNSHVEIQKTTNLE